MAGRFDDLVSDLQRMNFILSTVEQPRSEGRDLLLVGGAASILLPVGVGAGVRVAHDSSGRVLANLRYVSLLAGDPAVAAAPLLTL